MEQAIRVEMEQVEEVVEQPVVELSIDLLSKVGGGVLGVIL